MEKSCLYVFSYVTTVCDVSFGSGSGNNRGSEKQKKLASSIALFETLFTDTVLKLVMERCVIEQIASCVIQSSSVRLCKYASDDMRVIMFTKQPGERKYMFQEGVGKKFSRFRRRIVLTALLGEQRNKFGQCTNSTATHGSSQSSPTDASDEAVVDPV